MIPLPLIGIITWSAILISGITSASTCTKIIYVFVDANSTKDALANILPPFKNAQIYAVSTGTPGQDALEKFVGNQHQRTVMKDPDNIHKAIGKYQSEICEIGAKPKEEELPHKNQTKPIKVGEKIRTPDNIILTLDAHGPLQEFEAVKRLAIVYLYTHSLGGDGLKLYLITNLGKKVELKSYTDETKSLGYILEIAAMQHTNAGSNIVKILERIREVEKTIKGKSNLILSARASDKDKNDIKNFGNSLGSSDMKVTLSSSANSLWLDLLPSAKVVNVDDMADMNIEGPEKWKGGQIIAVDNSKEAGRMSFLSAMYHLNHLLNSYVLGGDGMRLFVLVAQDGKVKLYAFDNNKEVKNYIDQMNNIKFSSSDRGSNIDKDITDNVLKAFTRLSSFAYNPDQLWADIPGTVRPPTDKASINSLRDLSSKANFRLISRGGSLFSNDWHDIIPNMLIRTNYVNHGKSTYDHLKLPPPPSNVLTLIKSSLHTGFLYIRPTDEHGGRFLIPTAELAYKDAFSMLVFANSIGRDGVICAIRDKGTPLGDSSLLIQIKGGMLNSFVKDNQGRKHEITSEEKIKNGWQILGIRVNAKKGLMGLSANGKLLAYESTDTPFAFTMPGQAEYQGQNFLFVTGAVALNGVLSFDDEMSSWRSLSSLLKKYDYETVDNPPRHHNFIRREKDGGFFFINPDNIGDKFYIENKHMDLNKKATTIRAHFNYEGKDGYVWALRTKGQSWAQAHAGLQVTGGKLMGWFSALAGKKYTVESGSALTNGEHYGAIRYDHTRGILYLSVDEINVSQLSIGSFDWLTDGDLYAYGDGTLHCRSIFIANKFLPPQPPKQIMSDTKIEAVKQKAFSLSLGDLQKGKKKDKTTTATTTTTTTTTTTAKSTTKKSIHSVEANQGWFFRRRRR